MGWSRRRGTLDYWHFPDWIEQGIEIGFSTRLGGVSSHPYSSLNLGMHVGDNPEAVLENRKRWLSEWGAGWKDVAVGEQVHGTEVIWLERSPNPPQGTESFPSIPAVQVADWEPGNVKTALSRPDAHRQARLRFPQEDFGNGDSRYEHKINGVDGLLTQSTLGLMGFFADCVPLFFYEPVIGAVALAHAGWRGTAGKIALRILKGLAEREGRPENVRVAIGPSIGPCCYEIDDKVAGEFTRNFLQVPFLRRSDRPGHYFLDLWQANRQTLIEAGVPAEQIHLAGLCTSCHPEDFFSYRRDGQTGRMAGWIRRSAEGR